MISDCGIGELPAFGLTGVTRFTFTGTFVDVARVVVVRWMVAVDVPAGRVFGSALTARSRPWGGMDPEEGETLSHGSSTVAVKVCPAGATLPVLAEVEPEPGM